MNEKIRDGLSLRDDACLNLDVRGERRVEAGSTIDEDVNLIDSIVSDADQKD